MPKATVSPPVAPSTRDSNVQTPVAGQRPEDLLQTLLEAAPGFIASVDRAGQVLFANRPPRGLALASVFNRPIHEILCPDDPEPVVGAIGRVFSTGVAETIETSARSEEGSVVWYRTSLAPVRQDGHVVSVILDATDVTVLKDQQRELRNREERLQEAHRLAGLGTWVLDPRSGSFSWSRELDSLLGACPPGGRDWRAFMERVHPKDRDSIERIVDEARSTGLGFDAEHRIVQRSGEVRWIRLQGRVHGDGGDRKIHAAAQDVTEWKRAVAATQEAQRKTKEVDSLRSLNDLKTRLLDNLVEETTRRKKAELELRDANEKLVEAVRFKAELLNMLSHELGNPLTPLRLQLHYLNTVWAETPDPAVRKSLEIAERSLGRIMALSKDMLDVARLESHRLRIEPRPLDLAALARETVETFMEPARRANLRLRLEAKDGIRVEADARRLEQALVNLVGNAIKYTPGPGEVHVSCRVDHGRAVVEVTDTGLGFTAEQGNLLFRPFSRLHENVRGAAAGSGLGLYITHGIIEQHGGALTATSGGPGKGARFRFDLPLSREPHP